MSEYNLRWYGKLTIDNIDAIADLLRQLLDGKTYTFVACNEYFGFKPEVRTDQQISHNKAANSNAISVYKEKSDVPTYAGITIVDTYGVWSLSTSEREQTYVAFDWNKVTIEHSAPAGHKLWWCAAVQGE